MPKISACMPVYNTNPAHLREAIESILAQTFDNFELLILNDSPDNKELGKIVAEYKDPRIIYAENKENLGISDSRNRLIEMARGEYLAVCDHDDTWARDRFEKQAAFLDADPAVGVVGSDVLFMSEKPRVGVYPKSNDLIKCRLMHNCHLSHPSAMIRKSVLILSGVRYERQYSPAEDYMLWCRLIEFTRFGSLPDVLLNYRMHDSRTSVLQEQKMKAAFGDVRIFVRNKYPALFKEYLDGLRVSVRLLWVIPLLTIERWRNKTKICLFGFIPLLKIKRRW
jgi:glycosyltransferase involved in cell wall biosynthesis